MMRKNKWLTAIAVLAVVAGVCRAQEPKEEEEGSKPAELDLTSVLDDGDEVLKSEMEEAKGGDLKEFKVITDNDISGLEVGDIYKNNATFFKIVKVKAKGAKGGRFIAQRTSGKEDPGRTWSRVSGLGPLSISGRETLLTRFLSGGPLMYPIALLMLGTIVIAINSLVVYRRSKQCPDYLVVTARDALNAGDVEGFGQAFVGEKGLLAAICRSMLVDFEISTEEDIRLHSEAEARRQIGALRIPLKTLNFIAAVAPLLGLLGTVIGMIGCFESLAGDAASAGKSQAMAAGIKVALLTTAAGLSTAVPTILVFFIFNQRLNGIIADCDNYATEFVRKLGRAKRARESAGEVAA